MSENKALTVFDTLKQLNVHDVSREERIELGKEVLEILPVKGIIKNPLNALTYALYVNSLGLNPLRKEMYGWEDKKGNLQLQDPYDLKVTWARKQCEFDEWHKFVSHEEAGAEDGDIVCEVWILRRDRIQDLKFFTDLFGKDDALAKVATVAYGIVALDDQFYRYDWKNNRPVLRPRDRWDPKTPPSTWTWQMVARKRGISNALKISHGTPSTEDIRRLSWETAGDADVLPSDWRDVTEPGYAGEQEAQLAATTRKAREHWDSLSPEERQEQFENGVVVLRGTQEELDGDLRRDKPAEPKTVRLPEEFDDLVGRLAALSVEFGNDCEIEDGKDRFLVNKVFEKLGLGRINWKDGLKVAQASELLKQFVTTEEEDDEGADTDDSPGEEQQDNGGVDQDEPDPGQEVSEGSA